MESDEHAYIRDKDYDKLMEQVHLRGDQEALVAWEQSIGLKYAGTTLTHLRFQIIDAHKYMMARIRYGI